MEPEQVEMPMPRVVIPSRNRPDMLHALIANLQACGIPLSAILEDDIDPLSPDACDYGLDSISETTEDAAVGYFDPAGAVDDEKFLTSADWALCDIESSVLTAFGAGCSPELAGWTLGNAESVAETCALLGVDIATDLAPDNPARVAAAAKAATKATTHGVAAAAGNRL